MVTRTIETIEFWGGDLALDFANTVEGDPPRIDHLSDYADLVTWARRAGVLPANVRPEGDLASARELRDAIYGVFGAVDRRRQAAAPRAEDPLGRHADGGHRGHDRGRRLGVVGRHPDRPLWPIAVAAVDLLRSDKLGRLKRCANCNWLFLDRSRNGSRRWCSMDECGVHTKMRRYRASRRG